MKDIKDDLYYILKDKVAIHANLMEFAEWSRDFKNKIVKQSQIAPGIKVSTVFLGLNHNFGSEGPPILFETMIFGGDHDGFQVRYCTWDQAESGHEQAVNIATNETRN